MQIDCCFFMLSVSDDLYRIFDQKNNSNRNFQCQVEAYAALRIEFQSFLLFAMSAFLLPSKLFWKSLNYRDEHVGRLWKWIIQESGGEKYSENFLFHKYFWNNFLIWLKLQFLLCLTSLAYAYFSVYCSVLTSKDGIFKFNIKV